MRGRKPDFCLDNRIITKVTVSVRNTSVRVNCDNPAADFSRRRTATAVYRKQGGGYFGAKKGLRPLNVVWDYYATGDRSQAKLYVVNQTSEARNNLRVAVEFFNLDGTRQYFSEVGGFSIAANSSREAMTVLRVPKLSPTYLVRAALTTGTREVLAENVYWESTTDDDVGSAKNDEQFKTDLVKWADMSALNTMPRSDLDVSAQVSDSNGDKQAIITIRNPADRVAFFVRAEVTRGADGNEILPIPYDDNYITVFPHEIRTIVAKFGTGPGKPAPGGLSPAVRVEGYNVGKKVISLK